MSTTTIAAFEVSHKTAPLTMRERFALPASQVVPTLHRLGGTCAEVLLLPTCNRLAVYAVTDDTTPITGMFRSLGGEDALSCVAHFHEEDAMRHLLSTAAGLQSQLLGETQILGQIRQAYALAQEHGTVGPVLHEVVRRAICTGRRVRTETTLGRRPVSVASVARDLIDTTFSGVAPLRVVLIGTGEIARLMAGQLAKRDHVQVHVVSRSPERAAELASAMDGVAASYEELAALTATADVVIGATEASSFLLNAGTTAPAEHRLLLIDLGMPRNFDPALAEHPQVRLFDLDHIRSLAGRALEEQSAELPKAQAIVDEEMEELLAWCSTRVVAPVLSSLWERLESIRRTELQWALPKLGTLDEAQLRILERMSYRMMRRIARTPVHKIKEYARGADDSMAHIHAFRDIFGLQEPS